MNMTDDVRKALELAWQLMRCRAAGYRKAWVDSDQKDRDLQCKYHVYDSCASMLAEGLDGNLEVLLQYVTDEAALPPLPTGKPWHEHDWDVRIKTVAAQDAQ